MALSILDGATLRTVSAMKFRDGSTTRTVRTMKMLDGSTLRTIATFAPPMTASAAPSAPYGYIFDGGTATVTTNEATATPSGGLAPYTYSWALTSGVGSVDTPTSATTTFSYALPPGMSDTGTFTVTVTDAAGQTAQASVTASYENFGSLYF